MFYRHFLILVVLGVMAFFVASPSAGAAELVGATNHVGSVTLKSLAAPSGFTGLLVDYTDTRGNPDGALVSMPKAAHSVLDSLRLQYDASVDQMGLKTKTCARPLNPTRYWESERGHLRILGTCSVVSSGGRITTFVVQAFQKRVPDFGSLISGSPWNIYVSAIRSPSLGDVVPLSPFNTAPAPSLQNGDTSVSVCPLLTGAMRWSKYSSHSKNTVGERHFPLLFGNFTCNGEGIFGPGDHLGNPTTDYGRNVYIDTLDSDYGDDWRRVMGVLSQGPNGTFCYEFSPKSASGGKTGISTRGTYEITVIGPGLTPVVTTTVKAPDFTFGNDAYKPLTDKWGTNFSDGQAAALRAQAAQMGSHYKKKVKGSDCGKTLRQLPDSFFATR